MRSPIKLDDAYRELGLTPGTSLEVIRSSYRELALFWHPDRFQQRPADLAKAHQRMTRINLAYERIRKALAQQSHRRPARAATNAARARPQHSHHPRESRTNSLGMKFVSVSGISVLFSVWETRVQEYMIFAEGAREVEVSWKHPGFAQTAMHPVVNVSWNDAKRFCVWLTEKERREGKLSAASQYRLPTDSEWSWAIGIGDLEESGTPRDKGRKLKDIYPWGTEWPPPRGAGNYDPSLGTDSFDYTSPVGSFAANEQGLFDLGGNVWEWCEDFLNGVSDERVLRGGSWNFSSAGHILSSYRNEAAPDARSSGIGFRCVLASASGKI
jgi:hypothetical protein